MSTHGAPTEAARVAARGTGPPSAPGERVLAVGPVPKFHRIPRWLTVADVPDGRLPPLPSYDCRRTSSPPRIDGRLDDDCWSGPVWSEPFAAIADGARDGHETRVAMLWDDDHLYVGYRVTDPDVRASATTHHDQIYMTDDDVEIFIEGNEAYYELGVNAVNTVYEFRWSWVEGLVRRQDWASLEDRSTPIRGPRWGTGTSTTQSAGSLSGSWMPPRERCGA